LVSWNSNNHSSSDRVRVEWIVSWGVPGGPRRRTWSSLRRGGDLPRKRSGENSMCPDSAEFGNRYRCKPPRAPTSLTQSGYRVYKIMIELYAMNDISNCEVYLCCFFQLAYPLPFLFVLSAFAYYPFAISPVFGGSRAETRWRYPSWVGVGAWQGVSVVINFGCMFWSGVV